MSRSRGTTNTELDATSQRILADVRKRVDPTFVRTFRCRGGCEDSGWVESDDGLDERGKRVKSPSMRRCSQCGGQYSKPSNQTRGGSFS